MKEARVVLRTFDRVYIRTDTEKSYRSQNLRNFVGMRVTNKSRSN